MSDSLSDNGMLQIFSFFIERLYGAGERLKKTNSENVSTPQIKVLNVEFALELRIYRSLKSLICLK